jgi:hypothetical protein
MALVIGMASARTSRATEVGNQRTFGLGFALGAPTSLVGKLFVGAGQAIDFGVGFVGSGYGYSRRGCWDGRKYVNCNGGYDQLGLHADYLWQDNLVYGKVTLDWHIGAGARLWILDQDNYGSDGNGTVAVAARMPVGLDLMFQRPSFLEVFFEVVPSLYVVPGAGIDLEAALGARFYF